VASAKGREEDHRAVGVSCAFAIDRQETFALVVRNVGGKKYNSGRPDSVIQLTL
jgi:hypothetical protein